MKQNAISAVDFPGRARVHIGLAVADIERSVDFYRTLLGVEPCKQRTDYAKFEPTEPSLNLSLIQARGAKSLSNRPTHYGIQVKSSEAVEEASGRLQQAGVPVRTEEQTSCCYAIQDKVWAEDPDGNEWEVFVVTQKDSPKLHSEDACCEADSECCEESEAIQKARECCQDEPPTGTAAACESDRQEREKAASCC